MSRTRVLFALGLALGLELAAGAARADDAEAHFRRGVELYSEADYRSALLEFRRAYELDPRYQVLYNIGNSDYQLLDYAGALQAFERYLREGGKDVPAARRAEVEREIKKLKTRVAKLQIEVNVEGAEVSVDDVPVGKTPLADPVIVSAGRRRVGVTAPGRSVESSTVEVVGGDTKRVVVELAPLPAKPATVAPAPPPRPPPPTPPPPRERKVPWIGWVATGTLAAGGAVTGALALSASSDLQDRLGQLGVSQSEIDSAHSKTVVLGVVTDALLGAAVVAGGVSLYFTLRTPPREAAAAPQPGGARLAVHPGGATMEVTF